MWILGLKGLTVTTTTSTLDSHLGQNDGLGEGQVVSFPATYNDPIIYAFGSRT